MKLKSSGIIKKAVKQIEIESPLKDGGELDYAYRSVLQNLKDALLTLVLYNRDDRYRERMRMNDGNKE